MLQKFFIDDNRHCNTFSEANNNSENNLQATNNNYLIQNNIAPVRIRKRGRPRTKEVQPTKNGKCFIIIIVVIILINNFLLQKNVLENFGNF